MAMTRKSLKAMGLTDEQIDSIIEMHTETVDSLKDKLKAAEENANKLDGVQKELDVLKAKGEDGYKEKYEKEHKAFEDYKADVTAKQAKAAKESAAKAYFEGKNITGANLSIAMRGARDEIAGIELDENGKIKDAKALDDLVSGEYAGLIVSTSTKGAKTATPPANNGGGMTKEQIFAIKDAGERQKAIAEHLDLFT
jgi:hypothetical protein